MRRVRCAVCVDRSRWKGSKQRDGYGEDGATSGRRGRGEWMKGGFRADGLLLLRMGAILGMLLELEAELSGL